MSTPSAQPPRTGPRPGDRLRVWMAAGYALAGLTALGLPRSLREPVLDLLVAAVFCQGGILALRRAGREASAAAGWRLFATGLFSQGITQVLAFGHLALRGSAPEFPAWTDLFSYLSLALIGAGLLAFPLASASGSERLRKGVDGLGVAASLFLVSWFFALGPLFRSADTTSLNRLALVAFFFGNATILGIGTYLGARQPARFRGPLGWILGGFCISLVQVTLQVPLSLAGRYRIGDPLDLLVLLAGLPMALAPCSPWPLEPGPAPGAEARDSSLAALGLPMLPAALALPFAFFVLIFAPHRLDAPFIATGILLAGLGLLRGVMALRDLQVLSATLECRVQERTHSLEAAQELLLRTERLNSMAILGAGLAHDFKNLLGVVRLRSDLLADRLRQEAPGLLPEFAQVIEASEKAQALAMELLSVGREQTGNGQEVDLADRVQQLGTLLRAALPRSIHLSMDLPGRPARVQAHPGRLDQLVVNLVLNARDAMPEGGTLGVRVSLVRDAAGPVAELQVSDTGTGIPESLRDRIFDPFFTTKPPGLGTGLGLASVVQTVTDLRGRLDLSSEPGRGTTFTVRIPVCA